MLKHLWRYGRWLSWSKGIGEKTAIKLIQNHHSVENVIQKYICIDTSATKEN